MSKFFKERKFKRASSETRKDPNVSHILRSLLNSLGLDEELRQRRISCAKMAQMLSIFNKQPIPSMTVLLSGSRFETTTIDGLSSDTDTMYVYGDVRVIKDMEDWRDDGILTYLMDSTGCYSTFVKLRLCPQSKQNLPEIVFKLLFNEQDSDGNTLLQSTILNKFNVFGEVHGPAITAQSYQLEKDHVLALRCNFFPKEAEGWKQRQTPLTRTRIDPAIIDGANYCYLVAVGDKSSPTAHLQWRLAFSHIEHKLIHAWNNVQYQCYVLMKFILKDLIKPAIPETLCSYHMKILMLWMNEEYPAEFFISSNFEKCVLTYLDNLAKTVRERSLPHYFVTGCNLFHPKLTMDIDTAEKLLALIENIIKKWPRCLFDISVREFGKMLQQCYENQTLLPGICAEVHENRRVEGRRSELRSELHFDWRYFEMRDTLMSHEADNFGLLCKLREMKNNANCNFEHRQLIDFASKDVMYCISLEQIRSDMSIHNKTALRNIAAGARYIQRHSNASCCIDTRLKIAAYFLMTGNHCRSLATLDTVAAQVMTVTHYRCRHEQCTHCWCGDDIPVLFDKKPSMTEYFKRYMGTAVTYSNKNMPLVPKGLVYEMFRSTSVSPCANIWLYDWHPEAIIQCPVYMYYLRFLNYHAQGRSAHRKVALDNMEWASRGVSMSTHCETNHNIIGHCYRSTGQTRRAYMEYRKSLEIEKYNNAVLWHIAVLLRGKIRGEQ